MNFQPLTIEELTHIGKTLFGNRWKTPLAHAIKVPRERVSRWCSTKNKQDIPESLIPVIRALYHQGESYYKERRFNAKGRIRQIGNALLIHADSRKLPDLLPKKVDIILTDPVWPKPLPDLAGSHNPYQLLHDVLRLAPKVLTEKGRIIIHMRRDSDPRILLSVPPTFKFIGSAILPYAVPSRRGRMLNSYDIAYIFGKPPASRPGNRVLPGQMHIDFCPAARPTEKITNHPCPRHLDHVEWLVEKFSEPTDTVLDPFMGGGTTGVAALNRGRHFIGIEIEKKYWLEVQKVLVNECSLTDSNSLDNVN